MFSVLSYNSGQPMNYFLGFSAFMPQLIGKILQWPNCPNYMTASRFSQTPFVSEAL